MRIKSRSEREKDYKAMYGEVSLDDYTRLKEDLGNKFCEATLRQALTRIEEANKDIEYSTIRFTFYEIPIQAARPRTTSIRKGLYVPNAKSNYNAVDKFLKKLSECIKVIAVPIHIDMKAYLPMPKSANAVDKIIYETENDYAITKPDFDNILKAYIDMMQIHLIADDDLVVSCNFVKYYSLKPRVVLDITFPNGVITNHAYKTITSRKSYKELNCIETKLIGK